MLKITIKILPLIFYLASIIWKKDKNVWILGSWFGNTYSDNPKFLYEYMLRNKPDNINAYWITKNKKLIDSVIGCVYCYSIKGVLIQLRAGKLIVCQNKDDFARPLCFGKNKVIQLWHGVPIKKIGNHAIAVHNNIVVENLKNIKRRIEKLVMPWRVDKYDLVIASSDYEEKIYQTAFSFTSNGKVVKIGAPRIDALVKSLGINSNSKNVKKILYAPTFRGLPGSEFELFFAYKFNREEVISMLAECDAVLYLKFHPAHCVRKEYLDLISDGRYIRIIDKEVDISEELIKFQVLVTDYSSIYIDYLLTGGRVVLFQPDLTEYINKSRDSYINFGELKADYKVKDWSGIANSLNDIFNNFSGAREYSRFRDDISYFHGDNFGYSSALIIDKIKEM